MSESADPVGMRLVRDFQRGDEDAFRVLFDRLAPILRARVGRALPSRFARRMSVADVLQEVGLVAFQRRDDFTGQTLDDLRAWLLGITNMKVKKVIERHGTTAKRRIGNEVSRDARASTADVVGHGPTPSQVAIEHELRDAAREAFEGLTPDHREVLRLVRAEGLDLTQLAARLGRSYEAVRKLRERALYEFSERFQAATRSRHG